MRGFLLALCLIASPVAAHEWYDPECCNDFDCVQVEAHVIQATSEGWVVQVDVGDHPFAKRKQTVLIPFDHRKARVSQDGKFHLCLGQNSNTVFCIYVPPMGF